LANTSIPEPGDQIIEVPLDSENEGDEPYAKRKSIRPKSGIWIQFLTTKDSTTNKIVSNKCIDCMHEKRQLKSRSNEETQNCRIVQKNTTKLLVTAQATSSGAPASMTTTKRTKVNIFKQAAMENYASQIATKKKAIDLQLGRFFFSTVVS
jgi:hypothetical protein